MSDSYEIRRRLLDNRAREPYARTGAHNRPELLQDSVKFNRDRARVSKQTSESEDLANARKTAVRPFLNIFRGTNFQISKAFARPDETIILCNAVSFKGTPSPGAINNIILISEGSPYIPVVGATIDDMDTIVTSVSTNTDGTYNIALSTGYLAGSVFFLRHISYTLPLGLYAMGVNVLPQIAPPLIESVIPPRGITDTVTGKLEILDSNSNVLSTTTMSVAYTAFVPIMFYTVVGASWHVGIATVTVSGPYNDVQIGDLISIDGVEPFGYQGGFIVIGVAGNTISYALTPDPGAFVSGGDLTDEGPGLPSSFSATMVDYSQGNEWFPTFSAMRYTLPIEWIGLGATIGLVWLEGGISGDFGV